MAAGHPAQAEVRREIRRALREVLGGAKGGQPPLILAAVSGGADSLALAAGLAAEAAALGVRAGAVVVDHGLQTGSAGTADTAAAQCRELGLDPVRIERVQVDPIGEGVEAAARAVRLDALDRVAKESGSPFVLLGHTRDDQAEQVLLGLARGSGARSLAGMPARRGRLLRPLLGVSRATTHAACVAWELTPFADPMNEDPAFARVRARRALADLEADLGPGLTEALSRSADLLRVDADHLDGLARAALAPFASVAELPLADLAALPTAVRTRVLRRLLLGRGARPGDLSAAHVAAVDRLVTGRRARGPLHLPGIRVSRVGKGADARLSIEAVAPV